VPPTNRVIGTLHESRRGITKAFLSPEIGETDKFLLLVAGGMSVAKACNLLGRSLPWGYARVKRPENKFLMAQIRAENLGIVVAAAVEYWAFAAETLHNIVVECDDPESELYQKTDPLDRAQLKKDAADKLHRNTNTLLTGQKMAQAHLSTAKDLHEVTEQFASKNAVPIEVSFQVAQGYWKARTLKNVDGDTEQPDGDGQSSLRDSPSLEAGDASLDASSAWADADSEFHRERSLEGAKRRASSSERAQAVGEIVPPTDFDGGEVPE